MKPKSKSKLIKDITNICEENDDNLNPVTRSAILYSLGMHDGILITQGKKVLQELKNNERYVKFSANGKIIKLPFYITKDTKNTK